MASETKFEGLIRNQLEFQDLEEDGLGVKEIASFEDAGILTNNRGLVISLTDGSEFQLTIVRSKQPDAGTCDECDEEPPASDANPYCAGCMAKFVAQEGGVR